MTTTEHPQLRPFLAAAPDSTAPGHYFVWDRLGVTDGRRRFNALEYHCLQLCDGRHSVRDIQLAAMQQTGGLLLPLELFVTLVRKLDDALFLEGPRFRGAVDGAVREPRHIGCYASEPTALRRQLEQLFTGPQGPGLPRPGQPDGTLCAALLPHIDYLRGGATYAWGYKELIERTDASLFVIVGTSHYSGHRFTLTRKDFKTPLGVIRTDQDYIDRLVRHYGAGLFDDELMAHVPEHSIELEVVFLQYLHEGRRPIRIVPLVVGSFNDCVLSGTTPAAQADIGRMVQALRQAESETKEPICYLISGDLAHIGPKFCRGYEAVPPVAEPYLGHSLRQDQAILQRAAEADPAGFFRIIAEEGDARAICGLPPTYTVLAAVRPSRGKVLHYDRYVHPRGYESVSFASVAFYR